MTCIKKANKAKTRGVTDIARDHRMSSRDIPKKKCGRKQKKKLDIAFAWRDRGRTMVIMNEIASASTGLPAAANVQATPACLIPTGSNKPLKFCTSGWRKTAEPCSTSLDGARWTQLVRDFARAAEFQLTLSVRDSPNSSERIPENDGRYDACHAEKKLGLFFLAHQMRFTMTGLGEALSGKLLEAKLPLYRRSARIYLGHKPCKSCSAFLRLIKRRTGIDVRAVPCPVLSEHARIRTFFDAPVNNAGAFTSGPKNSDLNDGKSSEGDVSDRGKTEGVEGGKSGDDGDDEAEDDDNDDDDADDDNIVMSDGYDTLEAAEDALAGFPLGNVTRPRYTTPVSKLHEEEESPHSGQVAGLEEGGPEAEDDEPGLPARQPVPTANLSVRSSPSPSVSLASVLDSSVIDRRDRFPVYTSPSHRGGSAAPPSTWGARHKPPITPCLEAPDFGQHTGDYSNNNDIGGVSSSWVAANQQSYFFGTPSAPSIMSESGPAQASAFANANTGRREHQDQQQGLLSEASLQQRAPRSRSNLDILSEAARHVEANAHRAVRAVAGTEQGTATASTATDTPGIVHTHICQRHPAIASLDSSRVNSISTTRHSNAQSNRMPMSAAMHSAASRVPVVDLTGDTEDYAASTRLPFVRGLHNPWVPRREAPPPPHPVLQPPPRPRQQVHAEQQQRQQQQQEPDVILLSIRPATTGGGCTVRGERRPSTPRPPILANGRQTIFNSGHAPVPVQDQRSRRRRGVALPVQRGGRRGRGGRGGPPSSTARPFPDLSSFMYGDGSGWV
ncbi:hypothetical protein HMPREF1624_05296 [Sporothrix schenckii ATCC 58251]|uniref:Single-strand DNA deaminase toxin A-like C-terminal domain-containing protein n=1 Tax=Sporothrix schenckii (strain ATCC 58251 / de Perez 2211183) TaxID=1391915 RepID=U7PSE6_SPOS1|nr:hypothetical protein HMPREF1624_05296 [Sporothrix schenckii ATCC 58251]